MQYLFLFPCLILFAALIDGLPYVYFQLLRIVVTAFSGWFAYKEFLEDNLPLVVLYG